MLQEMLLVDRVSKPRVASEEGGDWECDRMGGDRYARASPELLIHYGIWNDKPIPVMLAMTNGADVGALLTLMTEDAPQREHGLERVRLSSASPVDEQGLRRRNV